MQTFPSPTHSYPPPSRSPASLTIPALHSSPARSREERKKREKMNTKRRPPAVVPLSSGRGNAVSGLSWSLYSGARGGLEVHLEMHSSCCAASERSKKREREIHTASLKSSRAAAERLSAALRDSGLLSSLGRGRSRSHWLYGPFFLTCWLRWPTSGPPKPQVSDTRHCMWPLTA